MHSKTLYIVIVAKNCASFIIALKGVIVKLLLANKKGDISKRYFLLVSILTAVLGVQAYLSSDHAVVISYGSYDDLKSLTDYS